MKSPEFGLKPIDYMDYPGIWELRNGPNPELLADYLTWITENDDRFQAAADNMQWYPPGFHGLLIAKRDDPSAGTHAESLQLNFYSEDHPGDEGPHGHSRDAFSTWYAPRGTEQILTRYQVLPDKTAAIQGLPVEERSVVAMCIGDFGDGRRPLYRPVELGRQLILSRSESNVAALGSQRFDSTEVHNASFRGNGVAISVHYKGPEEVKGLNELEGFVNYKGLSVDAAQHLLEERGKLSSREEVRLAPSTMIYPTEVMLDSIINRVNIPKPDLAIGEEMIAQGIKTVRSLTH